MCLELLSFHAELSFNSLSRNQTNLLHNLFISLKYNTKNCLKYVCLIVVNIRIITFFAFSSQRKSHIELLIVFGLKTFTNWLMNFVTLIGHTIIGFNGYILYLFFRWISYFRRLPRLELGSGSFPPIPVMDAPASSELAIFCWLSRKNITSRSCSFRSVTSASWFCLKSLYCFSRTLYLLCQEIWLPCRALHSSRSSFSCFCTSLSLK